MLVAVIGDIHGRFFRVESWLEALEEARREPVGLVLAVGDVETFAQADDHRRKATKRTMPAEFSDYASGRRHFRWPLHFVGGNNEAFEALEEHPEGGELAPNVRYLGRAGAKTLEGMRVAWLSGIYAPTRYALPRLPPRSQETRRQAGYFRKEDVDRVRADPQGPTELLLLHEWPRGIAGRECSVARAEIRGIRQAYWPNVGNPHGLPVINALRPSWVLCGHLHVPFATTLWWTDAPPTRVVCLDQATRPEAGLFWLDVREAKVQSAGWGLDPEPTWREGEPWDERQTAPRMAPMVTTEAAS
jgi:predicted phosphodiesterase